MNQNQANAVKVGDVVKVHSLAYAVKAVKTGDIAGPHFILAPVGHDKAETGRTSWKMCAN